MADKFDVQQLADKGTEIYVTPRHVQVLFSWEKDAKKMIAFVDLLSEGKLYECALVTHFGGWERRCSIYASQ